MEIESELFEICAQLQRDAGCRKVMVCGHEGEILAHAGDRGILDEAASDAIANIVADLWSGLRSGATATPPAEGRTQPELPGEVQVTLQNDMTACAAALADRATLVVVFDASTTFDRVKHKMRRARDRLVKSLPNVSDPTETPSKS